MIDSAWAQSGAGPGGIPPALVQMAPLLLVLVVFYFLLIRPQQLKQREHSTMLANLKKNDEVITTGGLYGTIVQLTEQVVTLEVAQNVRVRIDRQQVASLSKTGKRDGSDTKDKEKDKDK